MQVDVSVEGLTVTQEKCRFATHVGRLKSMYRVRSVSLIFSDPGFMNAHGLLLHVAQSTA